MDFCFAFSLIELYQTFKNISQLMMFIFLTNILFFCLIQITNFYISLLQVKLNIN